MMVSKTLTRPQAPVVPSGMVSVVAVNVPVAPGHELIAQDLNLIPIAGKAPPPNTFSDVTQVVGRVAGGDMVIGQPVLESLLTRRGTSPGLQALVPNGMRAITLEISESGALAGLLFPGSHVDVVTTTLDPEKLNSGVSRAIVQDVKVLGLGERLGAWKESDVKEPIGMKYATLLVTPHDAEAIDLAANSFRLRLTLRASGDTTREAGDGVRMAELRGGSRSVAVVPESALPSVPTTTPVAHASPVAELPPSRIVRLILGNEEQRLSFPAELRLEQPQLGTTDNSPPLQ
jgi:pilus assembly protein CpaB